MWTQFMTEPLSTINLRSFCVFKQKTAGDITMLDLKNYYRIQTTKEQNSFNFIQDINT